MKYIPLFSAMDNSTNITIYPDLRNDLLIIQQKNKQDVKKQSQIVDSIIKKNPNDLFLMCLKD
tara:strand:+ start:502 stop:690 length:189 start_codon:yes stop_codon:yes gene_type:complete